ncbi:MAG: single-stranded DNA-binding protein [Candidatus Aureabacteria bacterium]|nr:single-stranded DNA-binding protein [Candidatus Auribacterota bacterium]
MVSVNIVILGGNLTRDPEVRYTPQGSAVASFGLAVNRSFKTKDGGQKEEVCFVDVETWGRQAETVGEYLKKGRPVLVEGSLKLDSWEGKDGQKRTRHKVTAMRVQFLGSRGAPAAAPAPGGTEAAPPPAPFEEEFPAEEPASPPANRGGEDLPF